MNKTKNSNLCELICDVTTLGLVGYSAYTANEAQSFSKNAQSNLGLIIDGNNIVPNNKKNLRQIAGTGLGDSTNSFTDVYTRRLGTPGNHSLDLIEGENGQALTTDGNGKLIWKHISGTVTLKTVPDNYLSISNQQIESGIVPVSLGGTGANNPFNALKNLDLIKDNRNTRLGDSSLSSLTPGTQNTAIGYSSLKENTGICNVAVGSQSLQNNTVGHSNTATGYQSLLQNTTGDNNTAVGLDALQTNTTGSSNTAIGSGSLQGQLGDNITGSFNTAVGSSSLKFSTTGGSNTAVGDNSGGILTTGGNNVMVGQNSGGNLTTGNDNVFIGTSTTVGSGFEDKSNQICIGYNVNSKGLDTAVIGNSALSDLYVGQNGEATIHGKLDASNITTGTLQIHRGGTGATTIGDAKSSLGLGTENTVTFKNVSITDFPPENNSDVATKRYVDSISQGLVHGEPVTVATTENISFIDTTLVANYTLDGYTLKDGDRVLVKDQSDRTSNGIYVINGPETATQTDFDIKEGSYYYVEEGTQYGNSSFVVSKIDNGEIVFVQFSSAGQNTVGLGLTKQGNKIDLKLDPEGGIIIDSEGLALKLNASNITGNLSIQNGGTGANTVEEARNKLGVDEKGKDNSIPVTLKNVPDNYLSISNQQITSGTVPVSLGGTGKATPAEAREALGVNLENLGVKVAGGVDGWTVLGVNAGGYEEYPIGAYTTAIGHNALRNNMKSVCNTAIGMGALNANTNGKYNTAVGVTSMNANVEGDRNTGIGYNCGPSNGYGSDCCYVGNDAGFNSTGASCVFIGSKSKSADSTKADNNQICIGYDTISKGNNTAVIGNTSLTDLYAGENGGADIHCKSVNCESVILSPESAKNSGSPGTAGEIAWDQSNLYICIEQNVWKKIPLTSI